MPVASGPISKNLQKLVDLVAGSSSFQTRVGAADSTAAREFIHHPHLEVDESTTFQVTRPLAVCESGRLRFKKFAGGALNHLQPAGSCYLILQDKDRFPNDVQESQTDFENWVGAVIQDLAAQAGESDKLSIVEIDQEMEAAITHPRHVAAQPDSTAYWTTVFRVDWGWA
ncbi:MAG: hypothetical protein KY476_00735 [Planctomycetes bacterium]|nr:hypothetical protein [Planctomycetota bacterium]